MFGMKKDRREFKSGQGVDDTAGSLGTVVQIYPDDKLKVKWDDGSMTLESDEDLISA